MLTHFIVIIAYGDKLKDDVFKEKLGSISIKELTRTTKERRAGSLGFSEAMLLAYNKRNKSPLYWNTLYSGTNNIMQFENTEDIVGVKVGS